MTQSLAIPRVIPNDWKRLDLIINKIKFHLGSASSPIFADITVTGLTASRIVATDANKTLISLASPLIVAEGGTGAASLTDHGILLGSGTNAITPLGVAANGQIPIGSIGADPVLTTITGTTDHISVTNGAGSIILDLDINTQTLLGSFNGIFLEKIDFTISEASGTVTGSLEQDSSGDLIQRFSDGYTILDCTPALTINLTAYVGTNAVPKEVFVYILQSAKTVMAASNSDWPATEHIKIANLVLKSAITTGTDGGALVNRNWNDFASAANGEGHITHIEKRIRQNPTQWDSGIALTLKDSGGSALTTGNSSTAVEIVTTTGKVYQLHRHTFPAFDMYTTATDDAHVINQPTDEGGAYETTADLVTDVTHYTDGSASGVAIGTNKYFNLVIWGVQNRSGEPSHIMINLPTGQYTNEADATSDIDGTSIFDIPIAFKGTGFLIARLTFRLIAGAQWTYVAQEDLRGQFPTISAGVGVGTTDHTLLANLTFATAGHTGFQAQGDVLDDLNTLGAVGADNEFLVGTGVGALAWENASTTRTSLGLVIGTDVQAYDAGLLSLAGLSYVSASFVKMTGANTFALRTLQQTSDDLEATIDHDNLLNFAANEHYLQSAITAVGTVGTGTWQATDVGIAYGGTGQSNAQAAINALSAVSGATNEHVLTKDTATGNAIFKVAAGGGGGFASKVAVRRSANQVIVKDTWTKVEFDTEDYDGNTEYLNYRWTCKTAGYYHVDVGLQIQALASGVNLNQDVKLNGTSWMYAIGGQAGLGFVQRSKDGYFAVNDYLEVWVQHNDTVNRNLLATVGRSFFNIHRFG